MAGMWSRMKVFRRFFSKENIWAIVFCLIVIAVMIFTTDSSPLWIYQGF